MAAQVDLAPANLAVLALYCLLFNCLADQKAFGSCAKLGALASRKQLA